MSLQKILIADEWVESDSTGSFNAVNPATRETLPDEYPVSSWSEIDRALTAATEAAKQLRGVSGEKFAEFLEAYATKIEERADDLVTMANLETGLPAETRLAGGELPRTTNQLRQAAAAAKEGSWTLPTIDTATGIRSVMEATGPCVVFGPNNFPFAFNGIAGGDFAAAIAAGNPVIAKGHSSHPGTTRIFAEAALAASQETGMPRGFVQLIYRCSHADGAKLVSDSRVFGVGYTGARHTGLVLKEAADKAGIPIYVELSSVNPVFVLSGALAERSDAIAEEFAGSCLMGTGQFCTNPGVVVVPKGDAGEQLLSAVTEKFAAATPGVMLSEGVQKSFLSGVQALVSAGATLVAGGDDANADGFSCQNTLLRVDATDFLNNADALQGEAFGNGSLFIFADGPEQMAAIAECLEGNLTGCIYSHTNGDDDSAYDVIAPALRKRVGRLLNDKMPTGVAVSAAMNHGGPFPATGHPGFTAVGIPGSIRRFSMLSCYDNIRPNRLPASLQDKNPTGSLWRSIDGQWTQADV
ncbi:MAG: aldehyde dehydrogenase (NADP(+)) [Planctomycetaceae bacterium]